MMNYLSLLFCALLASFLLPGSSAAFQFDIWSSGISLVEANEVAAIHNIVFQQKKTAKRSVNTFISKRYTTVLMGYPAEVYLNFTADTKQLCKVYISWNGRNQIEKIHEANLFMLFGELKVVFHEKYSNKEHMFSHTVYDDTSWCNPGRNPGYVYKLRIDSLNNETIKLSRSNSCNWISIEYQDNELCNLQYGNIGAKQTLSTKDLSKF